ncbi:MAG: nucleotidyl transferase AbiEii/AbiGii toxin family protein [Propionibacteriaceae bacterium]|jgi:predicted nucleotidyltransferase component of viral defense system|nr:nucleotidyl transferase AbiEii/AbiGii toxin family protein [Propionibacteriaceae bacterium]
MSVDFLAMAERLAAGRGLAGMLPVIEKELLHLEILQALEAAQMLDGLVFQGGTCLRLCYDAARYSEDLDFVGGPD